MSDNQRRPATFDINRPRDQDRSFVETGWRGHLQSAAAVDVEIAELQERKKALAEQERLDRERNELYAKNAAKVRAEALAGLMAEMRGLVSRCPGTRTDFVCPRCSAPGEQSLVFRRLSIPFPGTENSREEIASLGAVMFTLKKQADGSFRCPRCSYSGMIF